MIVGGLFVGHGEEYVLGASPEGIISIEEGVKKIPGPY